MAADQDAHYMTLALEACRAGVEVGQSPFGACIVRHGEVLAVSHNHVWHDIDPSAHAEIVCLRTACKTVGDVHLDGATIYSTTEPCPMCFSCIHWARLARIVFAARVEDAQSFGFNELPIDNATLKRLSRSPIELTAGVMRDEAIDLYRHWQTHGCRTY